MTRVKSIKDIGLVYESMFKRVEEKPTEVVEEKKAPKTLPSFPQAKDKKVDVKKVTAKGSEKNAFVHKDSGPAAATGFNKNIVDPKTAKKDNHYEPQKFSSALEKTETEDINNNMSKSIFDKLYEDVMKDDALDLGIQAGPEGEAGDKAGDVAEGGDEVTLTLPHDVAKKLHDVLHDLLGIEGDKGEEASAEGEAGDEDEVQAAVPAEDENEKKEDKEEVAGEATDIEVLPDSKGQALTSKNNKVPGVLSHVKGGKGGDGKVTDKVGNDGDKGHALVGAGVKGGAPTSPKGKANVVPGVIKGGGKGDQGFFQ